MYQGSTDLNYKRDGIGVFLSDDSYMYLGEWLNDQMQGEGILCFPYGGYLYGNFVRNKI